MLVKYFVKTPTKHHGIGMLEMMLTISILALMVLASVMYFQSVSESKKAMILTEMVTDIRSAAKNYVASNELSTITMEKLIAAGLLSAKYAHTPWWAGDNESDNTIIVSAFGNDAIDIEITDILPKQCEKVLGRVKATLTDSETAECKKNTMMITYTIYESPEALMKPA